MTDPHRDSIALDAAYLSGSVTALIESMAIEAAEEVERARSRSDDTGDTGSEDNAPVV